MDLHWKILNSAFELAACFMLPAHANVLFEILVLCLIIDFLRCRENMREQLLYSKLERSEAIAVVKNAGKYILE